MAEIVTLLCQLCVKEPGFGWATLQNGDPMLLGQACYTQLKSEDRLLEPKR